MSAGYGRGYYGPDQLDRSPPRKSSLWFKLAVVAGIGAVAWWLWPRRGDQTADPPPPPSPDPNLVDQLAYDRGFPSSQAYEDAVVSSARELQAAGAAVELAPPLQYLTPRLEAAPVVLVPPTHLLP